MTSAKGKKRSQKWANVDRTGGGTSATVDVHNLYKKWQIYVRVIKYKMPSIVSVILSVLIVLFLLLTTRMFQSHLGQLLTCTRFTDYRWWHWSFCMEQKHVTNSTTIEKHQCINGVCVAYYEFPGGTRFQMKRSVDALTSHQLRTSSVPHVSHSLATLRVLIHPWTTAQRSYPVWPSYQGTGTADQANLVKLGSKQFNLMSLHSTLVWQLPIVEHKIDRHRGHLWKWQHPLDEPHDNDDDNLMTQPLWPYEVDIHQLRTVVWQFHLMCLARLNYKYHN